MFKMLSHVICVLFFVVVFIQLLESSADAYLDPGSGSLILQGIIAGLVTVSVVGRIYWDRLLRFFGLRKDKPTHKLDDKTKSESD